METTEPLLREAIGEALRRERLRQGRTLRDVASDAQISMPYLSEIERGRKEASSELLASIAHALGLRLVDLVARTGFELQIAATPIPLTSTRFTSASRPGSGAASASALLLAA